MVRWSLLVMCLSSAACGDDVQLGLYATTAYTARAPGTCGDPVRDPQALQSYFRLGVADGDTDVSLRWCNDASDVTCAWHFSPLAANDGQYIGELVQHQVTVPEAGPNAGKPSGCRMDYSAITISGGPSDIVIREVASVVTRGAAQSNTCTEDATRALADDPCISLSIYDATLVTE